MRVGFPSRLQQLIVWLMRLGRQEAAAGASANPTVGALPSARLRDLGFEADQVGGSIDFAKGQHYRHL
ncbi:hypothetical protein Rumeso_01365 [Rubellimicrobium mesophilum DSM 19309]|uniref:Uncharacterized protein n=1 Tax=Rubellimicrobium mesophilum DSM 19309 TaxID=442562 RepID=A0A017HRW1_9RHOB|nr:hypothetical protein Rumeso_01365 [Rubellimicrobium mesophilum DSM 19309]